MGSFIIDDGDDDYGDNRYRISTTKPIVDAPRVCGYDDRGYDDQDRDGERNDRRRDNDDYNYDKDYDREDDDVNGGA